MKNFIAILSLLFIFSATNGQQNYPKGVYMTIEEIKSKTPSQKGEFTVVKRTNGDIKMNGGNDYKIETTDPKTKKSFIKKEIFAYSDGDSLFLNAYRVGVQVWYAKVEHDGRYMIFKAGISNKSEAMKAENRQRAITSVMFGAIGALSTMSLALQRYLYIFDTESGETIAIDANAIERLLTTNQALLDSFNNEVDRESETVHIKYLNLLNDTYSSKINQ